MITGFTKYVKVIKLFRNDKDVLLQDKISEETRLYCPLLSSNMNMTDLIQNIRFRFRLLGMDYFYLTGFQLWDSRNLNSPFSNYSMKISDLPVDVGSLSNPLVLTYFDDQKIW